MKKTIFLILIFLITVGTFAQATLPRTVFVELFEWPWNDIANECEQNLGPNGFSAVQVSPPQEHISIGSNPWWERYQPISYKIYSRSGDEDQFKSMVQRCNAVKVDVYVDVVFNHMAGMADGHGIAGTLFTHYQYDNLYSYDDFHHCGRNGNDDIKNFNDLYELQNCELVNLADLKTESTKVQNSIANYLNKLISLGVKGFRIDAAKHMASSDISAIVGKLSKPVYIVQELITGSGDPIVVSDYTKIGDVSAYAYPFTVGQVFKNKNFAAIPSMTNYLPASADSVVFIDNHDLQRSSDRSMLISAQYDQEVFDLAQVFMLTYPFGYPQLYSSFKFKNYDDGPPVDSHLMTLPVLDDHFNCLAPFICEHKKSYVNALVNFRNKSDKNFYVSNWWTNGRDQMAYSRGNLGFVLINNSTDNIHQTFQTGLLAGSYCNLMDVNCSNTIVVNQAGLASINLAKMSALVLQF
jgi:alpha-amylase